MNENKKRPLHGSQRANKTNVAVPPQFICHVLRKMTDLWETPLAVTGHPVDAYFFFQRSARKCISKGFPAGSHQPPALWKETRFYFFWSLRLYLCSLDLTNISYCRMAILSRLSYRHKPAAEGPQRLPCWPPLHGCLRSVWKALPCGRYLSAVPHG